MRQWEVLISLFILSPPLPWWSAMMFSLSFSPPSAAGVSAKGRGGSAACRFTPALRPRGEWHSYAWRSTPCRFVLYLFFFSEFTQSSSSHEAQHVMNVSQTAPLRCARFQQYSKYTKGLVCVLVRTTMLNSVNVKGLFVLWLCIILCKNYLSETSFQFKL